MKISSETKKLPIFQKWIFSTDPLYIISIYYMMNYLFPHLCLHCSEKADADFFCSACSEFFELKEYTYYTNKASAFENFGPVMSLVQALRSGKFSKLIKGASSFLIMQYEKMKWPLPDVIVPLPENLLVKGDCSLELAFAFSKLLKRPLEILLRNKRVAFFEYEIRLKKRLYFQTLLFIGETLDERSQVAERELLKLGKEVYGLTLI